MVKTFLSLLLLQFSICLHAQNSSVRSSAEILQGLKKLKVLASVLYIGAHPDDENNGLLPFLAKEKLYRTAYLSLTRGEGGQNLIGDEQGIDLGMIRTQELLAARRMDGAEQYFTRAYEFGFSKSSEEALRIWNKEKILSDVVWVIRKYQPDVIIKRFPGDARAGHGHHAASAVLADEAFIAAADPNRFPEQFKLGVKPWQAKRILWNTFNFGGNNTTSEDQFKLDVGGYDPIAGRSYGEIGAAARTMHKSQGEGRPGRRGKFYEYFVTTGGTPATTSLLDGIDSSWNRLGKGGKIEELVSKIISGFKADAPQRSIPQLEELYQQVNLLPPSNWRDIKLNETMALIESCSGIFMEVVALNQLNVIGDSAKFSINLNNRLGMNAGKVEVSFLGNKQFFDSLPSNENISRPVSLLFSKGLSATQPYWLELPAAGGAYEVKDPGNIGKPANDDLTATFRVSFGKAQYEFVKPIQYKFTDPVRGELYQPVQLVNPVFINNSPGILIFSNEQQEQVKPLRYTLQANIDLHEKVSLKTIYDHKDFVAYDSLLNLEKGGIKVINTRVSSKLFPVNSVSSMFAELSSPQFPQLQNNALRKISYDHIPDQFYNFKDQVKVIRMDLKIVGKRIGYIAGAGDKVPQSLEAMGYDVRLLSEADITDDNLKQYDAIITGIRAYNIYPFLSAKNDVLMNYVQNGGNMIVQYLKSNSIGQKKVQVGPYPFAVDPSSRVTEEDAQVQFLLPDHPVLNFPNKITRQDFEGWIQERSTYQGVQADSRYQAILGMHDKNDAQSNGSLLVAPYGKGNFVYASLVFFRQLPAAVPGAYRLVANLVALPKRN